MSTLNQVPSDVEAERVVLGSLLEDSSVISDVLAMNLKAEDFHTPKHQTIYDAILRLDTEGKPSNLPSVLAFLRNLGEDAKVGGTGYLGQCLQVSMPPAVKHFAEIVKDHAVKRRMLSVFHDGIQNVLNPAGQDVQALISSVQTEFDLATQERASSDFVSIADTMQPTLNHMEDLGAGDLDSTGVPTGFSNLDRLTNGLHGGQMVVIAARPGVGKSTLGLDLARSCSIKHKMPSLIFSLEMSREEITMRMLSAECRVDLAKIRSGKMDDSDWAKISSRMGEISEAPLYIDDTATITMTEIKAKARRMKAKHGLRLIILDYLQLMQGDGRSDSRQQEVSDMSRNCKLLAKELNVPVVVMSQLNRGSEQRADKKPQVSDLRESGSIEQDADMIILLFREDMADPDSTRQNECDLMVAKQRNGPTGVIPVAAHLHHSRFVDMAYEN